MRYTEYHGGVAVIKDKALQKEAMAKLAKYEDAEDKNKAKIANIENMSREDIIECLNSYCTQRTCGKCIFGNEICAFGTMDEIRLKEAYKRVLESLIELN